MVHVHEPLLVLMGVYATHVMIYFQVVRQLIYSCRQLATT